MNKSLRRELFREIRGSWNRFLSILVMVALGVMFLVGLRSAAPDMRHTADSYFDDAGFYDIQILSTLGLTEEDIIAFAQVDGVNLVEGGWSLDASAMAQDSQKVVKVLSLSQKGFNEPTLVEGTLPTAANECAVDERLLLFMDVTLGDTITIETAESYGEALTETTYVITAIVTSPLYIALDRGTSTLGDGSVGGFILLPQESFSLDYYTVAYLWAEEARELDAYSTEYEELISDLTEQLELIAQSRGDLRYETLVRDAQAELEDANAQLIDAQGELTEAEIELDESTTAAEKEIADAEETLTQARAELDDGWCDLEEAKESLAQAILDGQEELENARTELDDGWTALAMVRTTLNQSQATLNSNKSEAESQLEAARQELEAGEEQLAQKQVELEVAEAQVEALRQQVSAYTTALEVQKALTTDDNTTDDTDDILETLATLQAMLQTAELQLAQGQAALAETQEQLAVGWDAYNSSYDETWEQLNIAQGEINSGWSEYYAAKATLEQGEEDYQQGLEEYENQIAQAQEEIADAEATLIQGEEDYLDGLQELEDAKTELTTQLATAKDEIANAEEILVEAQIEIDNAQAEIDDIEPPDVYVLNRDSNYGFVSYDQNASRMENLARMFPLIFFIVAALVCLTTMTRMVEEERTQIGAIKAMGYGTGTIALKYLLYGILAALAGSMIGAVIGVTILPWVVFTSYGVMYSLPDLQLLIQWDTILWATVAALACTAVATLWAMLSTARLSPALLMRPKTPKSGKRVFLEFIPFLWKRLSFSMKVSARNLFRYKKRFWMTVIGVAGCTALLISGLGLRSAIFSIIDIQYGDIYRYNLQVAMEDTGEETLRSIETLLMGNENVASLASAQTQSVTFYSDNGSIEGYLTVTDDPEALYEQIDLRSVDDGTSLTISDNGVIIDKKLAELLALEVGDPITIDCGGYMETTVVAINEHYAYHYAYMMAIQYEALTGEVYEANEYLITTVDTSDEAISELAEILMSQKGVASATNLLTTASTFRENMEVVNTAVTIIIFSAALLAMVVLYNLTNINITERLRELATIKVLGFYDLEVAMYVYRENIVLTLFGIILGQLCGKFLCTYLIRTVEMEIVMFGREAQLHNYLESILLSLLFAVIVNGMMYFHMKKIDMVESLKSVE